ICGATSCEVPHTTTRGYSPPRPGTAAGAASEAPDQDADAREDDRGRGQLDEQAAAPAGDRERQREQRREDAEDTADPPEAEGDHPLRRPDVKACDLAAGRR